MNLKLLDHELLWAKVRCSESRQALARTAGAEKSSHPFRAVRSTLSPRCSKDYRGPAESIW